MYIGKQGRSQISPAVTTLSLENNMGKNVRGEADTFNMKEMLFTYFEYFY